jgi:hypothetical protein
MLRKFLKMTLAGAMGLLAVVVSVGGAISADDKLPDIPEIMKKGHAKTDGYIAKIRGAAKNGDWDDANKYAKSLAMLGEALSKNKPPKGEAESWEKLTKKYVGNTKLVLKGTEDKDVKAVNKGLGGINCGECHKQHKQ